MKSSLVPLAVLLMLGLAAPAAAQLVRHQSIDVTDVDMSGPPVILASQEIPAATSGTVVVQFDGTCTSSLGDAIMLAASDDGTWSQGDGHTIAHAEPNGRRFHSFSHTRVYPVEAGWHTFHAVGQRWADEGGSGLASVQGNLLVKFYPTGGDVQIRHAPVFAESIDVRGAPVPLAQRALITVESGVVFARFDGWASSSDGDRIVVGVSDDGSLGLNDESTSFEVIGGFHRFTNFTHSRAYAVGPGLHNFFAVAQNLVETAGDGIASFYGNFTLEFIPDSSDVQLSHVGVLETSVVLDEGPVVMASRAILAPTPGKAVVRYEGHCVSSPLDRVVHAASNSVLWDAAAGGAITEAYDDDVNRASFSQTRVFDVQSGLRTFWSLAEISEDLSAGSGLASTYGSFSVMFFPEPTVTAAGDDVAAAVTQLLGNHPNPFNPSTTIAFDLARPGPVTLAIHDVQGRLVRTLVDGMLPAGPQQRTWNGTDARGVPAASGVYLCRLQTADGVERRSMVLAK
jgi:hypothetical protein